MENKNPYLGQTKEELNALLENPQDIETGCERNCDECKEAEIKLIKEVLGEVDCAYCGGETGTKLIGDEIYNWCKPCNRPTM